MHDLERDNPDISIPNAAFKRVFDLSDGYRWRLDSGSRSPKTSSPKAKRRNSCALSGTPSTATANAATPESLSSTHLRFRQHSQRTKTRYKATGKVIYDEFDQKPAKPIVDQSDRTLAHHYGFTEEELDFIINYDIKYRMGKTDTS